jgi:hypothetical protein
MIQNSWITLLAYEPRIRHAANRRREEVACRRLTSVHSRVLAQLRCAVALDIDAFLDADGDRRGSALTCKNGSSLQGFVISRADNRLGTRSVAIDLDGATLTCRYEICGNSIFVTDQWAIAIEIGNGRADSRRLRAVRADRRADGRFSASSPGTARPGIGFPSMTRGIDHPLRTTT